MQTELPQSIREALATLVTALAALEYVHLSYQQSAAFGDFEVVFSGPNGRVSLTRDRGEFMVGGQRNTLEPLGLWRAFGSITELQPLLLSWLQPHRAA